MSGLTHGDVAEEDVARTVVRLLRDAAALHDSAGRADLAAAHRGRAAALQAEFGTVDLVGRVGEES